MRVTEEGAKEKAPVWRMASAAVNSRFIGRGASFPLVCRCLAHVLVTLTLALFKLLPKPFCKLCFLSQMLFSPALTYTYTTGILQFGSSCTEANQNNAQGENDVAWRCWKTFYQSVNYWVNESSFLSFKTKSLKMCRIWFKHTLKVL